MLKLTEGYTVYKGIYEISTWGNPTLRNVLWTKSRMSKDEAYALAEKYNADNNDEEIFYAVTPDLEYYGFADPIRWLSTDDYNQLREAGEITSPENYHD